MILANERLLGLVPTTRMEFTSVARYGVLLALLTPVLQPMVRGQKVESLTTANGPAVEGKKDSLSQEDLKKNILKK